MANNFASNLEKRIASSFGKAFQSERVLTKTINSTIAEGKFSPKTGNTIYVRKPYEAKIARTSGGNITGLTDDIKTGQVPVTVMDMFTTFAEWDIIDEALKMESMDEIMKPYATRLITELELDIANRMLLGGGLLVGTPGTAVTKWSDVAAANTLLTDIGAPATECYYVMTPGTQQALADAQKGLSNGDDSLVNDAWRNALVSKNFGGLTALSSNCLKSFQSGAATDRAGTITGTVTQTWDGNKDATTQTISVTAFSASLTAAFRVGDVVQITGRNRVNPHTGQLVVDASGNAVKFTGVVQATTDTAGSGVATITISGNAIYEASYNKYNNIDSSITAGDAITLLGAADTVYKPNLFFHKDAFTMATIPLPRLHSTDAYITTKDGFSIRVSKYANGDANTNKVRFDLLAAFGVVNPHMAGRGHGI